MTHQSPRPRFLMCRPDEYDIDYVINPWMAGNEHREDRAVARKQWEGLRAAVAAHADVRLMDAVSGLPDLVFCANAGLPMGRRVVLSRFRHPQRAGEAAVDRAWFEGAGFEVLETPEGVTFEGAGDTLLDTRRDRLWMGYGFRTALEAAEFLQTSLGVETVPLRLVDERFYHLDTCFCPLEGGRVIYYPPAFDERARRAIEEFYPEGDRIAVSDRDAVHFACNAVNIGEAVIMNACSPELEAALGAWGFRVTRTPLSEFILAGGSAKCLTLSLSERTPASDAAAATGFARRVVTMEGHLLDNNMLARTMDRITQGGGAFEVVEFRIGQRKDDKSFVRLAVSAPTEDRLDDLLETLITDGARAEDLGTKPARLLPVEKDGVAPDDFYCTTIYPTEVLINGEWILAAKQRMDGCLCVRRENGRPTVTVMLMRNLRVGDEVVVGADGIRLQTKAESKEEKEEFSFMSSTVSSERRVETAVESIAWEMRQIRARRGKIVLVSGPVAVHTGGVPYLCELVRMGFINAVLAGNALAVHDIERQFYGTSLGVDLLRGVPVHGGHRHHLTAINTIRRCGSIANAVAQGVLKDGLMFELVKHGVPYCLAGSIRDDGPLPDTEMDLIEAQAEYTRLLEGAEMILMLSSMLHSIGVGNMTPAGVKLVCVDINTAVATKLADRGSIESVPVVTDVGLFLNLLVRKLQDLRLDSMLG